jgi:hypothetical protein
MEVNRDFPRRATAPTLTQIQLIRRMVWSICSPDSSGMKGSFFGGDKDLKPEWVPAWKNFYNNSFFYEYILKYHDVVRKITDMSHLWYREFYLEITKCIQFPISLSMPWILTEYLINAPSIKENMFFPIDIYNDAASRSLVMVLNVKLFLILLFIFMLLSLLRALSPLLPRHFEPSELNSNPFSLSASFSMTRSRPSSTCVSTRLFEVLSLTTVRCWHVSSTLMIPTLISQLVFLLSEDIFKYFKTVASSVQINNKYKKNLLERNALKLKGCTVYFYFYTPHMCPFRIALYKVLSTVAM